MPLEKGPVGGSAFKHNIETEVAAGKPQKQAVAIAYRVAERKDEVDEGKLDVLLTAVDALAGRMDALERRRDQFRMDREFRESDHPRDEDGKFSESGSGSSRSRASLVETRTEGGKRVQSNGSPLPNHIQKLKIPPAWTDVRYHPDPDADLLATGKDSKGRVQAIYSERFTATQAAAKFERIHELSQKFGYISEQNEEARRSDDARIRDSADCLMLIMQTGVRPGSDEDTGAKVKAYGATTLEGRHVVIGDDGSVSLKFVGKKGVSLDLPVPGGELADMLRKRADAAGPDGKLFPHTDDARLRDHVHTLDGGGFKTKDFRTHLGTETAYRMVATLPKPTTQKEYQKAVMEIARHVSRKLGNTPTVALQSYISPTVFAEWRIAA